MSDLRPRLDDIRFSFDLMARHNDEVQTLDDDAFRALMALVTHAATSMVWTYSPPTDGGIKDDDERLARITWTAIRKWRRLRPQLEPFFDIRAGFWYLNRPWIEISGRPARIAVPAVIRGIVTQREGKICTYCGDQDGPFDLDHIYPVVKGGPNDASNLTLACAACNRSKGGKTLMEWVRR